MKLGYNWIIIAIICASTIFGCFLYCLGFQKQFSAIDKHSQIENPYINEMHFENEDQRKLYKQGWFPQFKKKIFLYLVDSLRYDQVTDVNKQKEIVVKDQQGEVVYFPSSFTSITDALNKDRNSSLLIRGVVDTQTMTITRIKALSTGTIPSFTSMFDQISSQKEIEDNLFYQLKQRQSPQEVIYLYGVDLWNQYFAEYFDYQSLNINSNLQNMIDNSPIFNKEILDKYLKNHSQTNWTFFINHDGGIDSLMHGEVIYRFEKPFESPLYQQAMDISNNATREFIQAIDEDTTFILFSDHGFTNYGTHGGKEIEERLSVIFGYDKIGFIKDRNISQKMDPLYLDSETDQIDLLPTICMLKGLAIPSNNIGAIIPDFFIKGTSNTIIANAYYTNMRQIEDYFDESIKHHLSLSKQTYEHIKDLTQDIKDSYQRMFTKETFTASQQELSQFISAVIHLSHISKEAARKEGEIKYLYMYFAFATIVASFLCSVTYIVYNDAIISHNFTSSEKHLNKFILTKFILGSFLIHLSIFFVFTGINVLLLINVGAFVALITLTIDYFYSRYTLYSQPKYLLKGIKVFSSFKFDIQNLAYAFLLLSFSYIFINIDLVDDLDFYIFLITSVLLIILTLQLIFIKGKIFSSKLKMLLQICAVGFMSFFCMYMDPFIQKDVKKINEKNYLNIEFINILSYDFYNTVIPLVIFVCFYFYKLKDTINQSMSLSMRTKFVLFILHTALITLLSIYFVTKNYFHDSQAIYFFRNFFPLSSYILVILQILFINICDRSNFYFIIKYKLFLWSLLPSFLYLMDYQCITLMVFFFLTFQYFHNIINFLNYRPYSLLYTYLTVVSFQYFYVSGHKFAFEFMHLHTHAVGLFVHSDFFSNINVFVGNYSFFFLAFLQFPILLNKDTKFQYLKSSNEHIQENKNPPQIPTHGDSSIINDNINHNENDQVNLIYSQHELTAQESTSTKGQENQLTPQQAEIKNSLTFSKSLIFVNLPIIMSLIISFLRNICFPITTDWEKYSTVIVFLTTIFMLSSVFAQLHFFLQEVCYQFDFNKKYLKLN
ncbi:hypothetical protein ABPG74_003810 [Tetrahymena malaccensis]